MSSPVNENNVARCMQLTDAHDRAQAERDQQNLQALIRQQEEGRLQRQRNIAEELKKAGSKEDQGTWAKMRHKVRRGIFLFWSPSDESTALLSLFRSSISLQAGRRGLEGRARQVFRVPDKSKTVRLGPVV
jgi:hypothetical protein